MRATSGLRPGGHARASMELRNPDGTEVGPEVSIFVTFGCSQPVSEFSISLLYYPSAVRGEAARVLEIKAGERHIKNIDFMVRELAERTLQVRARWADGRPVDRGEIHIAYEHTGSWENLVTAPLCCSTDGTGNAEIHVFGDSRVRVFAEGFVGGGQGDCEATGRSGSGGFFCGVELAGGNACPTWTFT